MTTEQLCVSRLGDSPVRMLGQTWVRCTACDQTTPAVEYLPDLDAYLIVSHPVPHLARASSR